MDSKYYYNMETNLKQNKQIPLPIVHTEIHSTADEPIHIITESMQPINMIQLMNRWQRPNNKPPISRQLEVQLRQALRQANTQIQRLSSELTKYKFSKPTIDSKLKQVMDLKKERESIKRQYELLFQKHSNCEKEFHLLHGKCEHLENQLKNLQQLAEPHKKVVTSITHYGYVDGQVEYKIENQRLLRELASKDNEIRSIHTQVKLLKEQIIKVKAIDNQKRRIGIEINQMKQTTDQLNFQKGRLIMDLTRMTQEVNVFKKQNMRLFQQVNIFKSEHIKLADQNMRLKNEIAYLKNQIYTRQAIKIENQNLFKQIQTQKNNTCLYANECHRIANQLINLNAIREKEKQELTGRLTQETERDFTSRIKLYQTEIDKTQKDNNLLKQKIQQIKEDHEKQRLKLREELTQERKQSKQDREENGKIVEQLKNELLRETSRLNKQLEQQRSRFLRETNTCLQYKAQINRLKQENQKKSIQPYSIKIEDIDMKFTIRRLTDQNSELMKKIQSYEAELTRIKSQNVKHNYEAMIQDYNRLMKTRQIENNQNEFQIKRLTEELAYQCLVKGNHENTIKALTQQNKKIKKDNVQIIQLNTQKAIVQQNSILKRHLQLSVAEIRQLHEITQSTHQQLMFKVNQYSKEKQENFKKCQYLQFELQKLQQLLQARKAQLQACYKTIEGQRKQSFDFTVNHSSLNQILKTRRENLF